MPVARLTVLGDLALTAAGSGAAIGSPRRKPLAVLAILAVAGSNGADRDAIASLLWSDLDDLRGRRALAQSLYAIRREVGEHEIVEGTSQLRLRTATITSDLGDLEGLFAQTTTIPSIENATRLATCYRGAFLEGVYFTGAANFDQWAEAVRARLERKFVASIYAVATSLSSVADIIPLLELTLSRVPHSTQLALLFARKLVTLGRVSEARSILVEHSAAVRQLLGADPPEEVRRALDAIREHAASGTHAADKHSQSAEAPLVASPSPNQGKNPVAAPRTQKQLPRKWAAFLFVLLATSLGIAALRRLAIDAHRIDSSDNEVVAEFRKMRATVHRSDFDSSQVGRIMIFSPSELSGRPALRALAPKILDELYAELGRINPDLVDRGRVVRLEREAQSLDSQKASTPERHFSMMRVANAKLGLRITYQQRADSIYMFLEGYVESFRYTDELQPGPGFVHRKAAMRRGISWYSDTYGSGPLSSFAVVNSTAASNLRNKLALMGSCAIKDHLDFGTPTMCWMARNQIFSFGAELGERRRERFAQQRRDQHVLDSLQKAGRQPLTRDLGLYEKLRALPRNGPVTPR
jgi:DNA-binding SARP family transcriptional activator